MDDSQIIALYFQRKEQAISATAIKFGSYCMSVAANILRDRRDAEEAVSDAWMDAWNTIPPTRPKSLRAFLATLTRRRALDRYDTLSAEKRGGGQVELVLDELRECVGVDTRDEVLTEIVLQDAINRFLRSQFPVRRAAFLRRYWYMEPIADIAKALGLRQGQTRTILYRMRRELKEELEKEDIKL